MSLQVIGAGYGRTGTFSLKLALEQIGFGKCFHMFELAQRRNALIGGWRTALRGQKPDWDSLFDGYRSTVDFPACLYYQDLIAKYPEAKVVLTYRDPESWYDSAYQTILTIRPRAGQAIRIALWLAFSETARNTLRLALHNKSLIEDRLFSGRVDDRDHVIGVYERHLESVKRNVPSDRLLVYQVREGWNPLCEFLDVPVPSTPFPHKNDEGDFAEQAQALFFSF